MAHEEHEVVPPNMIVVHVDSVRQEDDGEIVVLCVHIRDHVQKIELGTEDALVLVAQNGQIMPSIN